METILCPQCGSENCQSFSVINAHGTSVINTTTHTGGVGIVGGRLGFGGGKSHHSGVEQTTMGALTAPPARKAQKAKAIWTVVLLFFALLNFTPGGNPLLGVVLLLFGLIAGYFAYKALKYNTTTWRALYEKWDLKWLCNKCGATFEVGRTAENAEVAATVEE